MNQKDTPIIETSVNVSKDRRWLIHKTIITDIKPITFYKVVLGEIEPKPKVIVEDVK